MIQVNLKGKPNRPTPPNQTPDYEGVTLVLMIAAAYLIAMLILLR